MPKYEIGRQVFWLGLAVIAAGTVVALVALGAKDVLLYVIDAMTKLHATQGLEGVTS